LYFSRDLCDFLLPVCSFVYAPRQHDQINYVNDDHDDFDDDIVAVDKAYVFLTTLEHTSSNDEPTKDYSRRPIRLVVYYQR